MTTTQSAVTSQPQQPQVTRSAPVATPFYRVTEAADAYTVHVHLPDVTKEGVETAVNHDRLTIHARRGWKAPEGWTVLHRETRTNDSQLVLELSPEIDQSNITADLVDGVLKVTLGKSKALKPRKIEIA